MPFFLLWDNQFSKKPVKQPLTDFTEKFIIQEKAITKMASLQQTLNTLDYKCWYYETALKAGTTDILQNMPIEDIPEQFQEVRQNLTHVPMPTSA